MKSFFLKTFFIHESNELSIVIHWLANEPVESFPFSAKSPEIKFFAWCSQWTLKFLWLRHKSKDFSFPHNFFLAFSAFPVFLLLIVDGIWNKNIHTHTIKLRLLSEALQMWKKSFCFYRIKVPFFFRHGKKKEKSIFLKKAKSWDDEFSIM